MFISVMHFLAERHLFYYDKQSSVVPCNLFPISIGVASMEVGQSCDQHSAREAVLRDIDKIGWYQITIKIQQ